MSDFIGGIGTSFTIEDRASTTLLRISEAMEKVQGSIDEAAAAAETFSDVRFGGLTRSLGSLVDQLDSAAAAADKLKSITFGNVSQSVNALDRAVTGLNTNIDAVATSFESAMSRIAAESVRGEQAVNSLDASMTRAMMTARGLGAAASGIGGAGRGGGGGGGRRGGDEIYPHGKTSYMYTGGGHVSMHEGGVAAGARMATSLPAMAAGYGAYKAIEMGLDYDAAVNLALVNLGIPDPSSPEGVAARGSIERTIDQSVSGTTFAKKDIAPVLAQAYPMVATGVQGSPAEQAKKMEGLMSSLVRFAEVETKYEHKGDMGSNIEAGVGLAHMMRIYDPDAMKPVLNQLLAATRLSSTTPTEMVSALKYSMSTGNLAGVDPKEMMSTTGFLFQSGTRGSTAGTGPANMLYEILKGEAPTKEHASQINAALRQRQDFESAIHGTVGVGRQVKGRAGSGGSKSQAALADLGVIDPKTHQILPQFVNPEGGFKETDLILQIAKRAEELNKKKPGLGGADVEIGLGQRGGRTIAPFMGEGGAVFKQYIEMQERLTKLVGALTTQDVMSKTPSGEVQQAWARLEDLLTKFATATDEHGVKPIDRLGAAAGALAGLFEKWTGILDKLHMPGFEDYNKSPGAKMPGLSDALDWAWKGITGHHLYSLPPGDPSSSEHGMRGGGPTLPDVGKSIGTGPRIHPSSATGSGDVHVNIQSIHFAPGTPREHADQLAHELARSLSNASLHDLGTGWGHQQSSYSNGRTVSI